MRCVRNKQDQAIRQVSARLSKAIAEDRNAFILTHNLKVRGSNPLPATTDSNPGSLSEPGFLVPGAAASASATIVAKSPKSSAPSVPSAGVSTMRDERAQDPQSLKQKAIPAFHMRLI